jgi:hypothetical protein
MMWVDDILCEIGAGATNVWLSGGSGAEGARAVADALRTNSTVIALSCDHNDIGDSGVRAVVDVLRVNSILTTLNLADNDIGAAGVRSTSGGSCA